MTRLGNTEAAKEKQRLRIERRCDRAMKVNKLIKTIGSCGGKFFHHEGRYSHMWISKNGRVWYRDKYTLKKIYTHRPWTFGRYFTEGGTLEALVRHFRRYIMNGTLVPARVLGPWPDCVCDGDLWGYGEDMERVREKARELEIIQDEEKD